MVLVHGMGRTRISMSILGRRLKREGYRVVNWGYSSRSDEIPALGAALAAGARAGIGDAPRVHFVGHSLGNILVRWALVHSPPPAERVGRVVMLAPPNQGSAAADRYATALGWLLRPISGLRTDPTSVARSLPVPTSVEIGIVAGARDGKVSVEETRLEGARDHVVVPGRHSFIMNRGDVHRLVLHFLRDGRFPPAAGVRGG